MTDEQFKALEANPVFWLRAQTDAIMGAAGDDYWCEPVSVFMVLADILESHEKARASALNALNQPLLECDKSGQ